MKRTWWFGVLAMGLALAVIATARVAGADEPATSAVLSATPDTIVAGIEETWPVTLQVRNGMEFGLYLDSLVVEVTPKHAGPAPRRLVLRSLSTGTVSAGDATRLDIGVPAGDTDASIALTLNAHTMRQPSIQLRDAVFARAFDLRRVCPSRVVKLAGRDVEMALLVAGDNTNGAGVLLLPDASGNGDAERRLAIQLARGGFSSLVLLPPGSGRSKGPDDFAGPASLAAAQAALDTLAARGAGQEAKLAVWGRGHGGTLALLLAAKRPALGAVVAEGATFDPWASYRALPATARGAYAAAAGRDSAAWRARSPLANAAAVKSPVLVLHGERDATAPASAAHAFVSALQAASATVESKFYPTAGDTLPATDAERLARRFLFTHVAR